MARRREKRQSCNAEHGIMPASIKRGVAYMLGSLYEQDHVTVDAGIAKDGMLIGHNLKATIADMEKAMRNAAADLDFETAARLGTRSSACRRRNWPWRTTRWRARRRSMIGPGGYRGARKYGDAANMPATRARKPTDADMGPHNLGGGKATPLRGTAAPLAMKGRSTAGTGGTRALRRGKRG